MAITKLNAAALPAGSIVKSETKIISAFGNTNVASTSSYNDVPGTEVSFTRSFANSKILGLWNLKITSGLNVWLQLNRKIGSGSYAVVNVGASAPCTSSENVLSVIEVPAVARTTKV